MTAAVEHPGLPGQPKGTASHHDSDSRVQEDAPTVAVTLDGAPARVLMVIDSLQVGGAERHMADLASALKRRHHPVTVACSTSGMLVQVLEAMDIPVHILMKRLIKRRVSFAYSRNLRRLLRQGGFDLVHAHLYASAAASAIATIGTATPLVITDHSEATWRRKRAHMVSRLVYRRADRVIAVSKGIHDSLIRDDAVAPDRITVIPNAVTPLNALEDAVRLPAELVAADPVVGMVARLQPEKGVQVFMEAIPAVLERHGECHFLLVGDGPLRPELEAIVAQRRLQDRVHFLGFQKSGRDFIRYLDLLVLPSLSEGTPLVVLESMAAGVPVVASRVGGIPEQLVQGQEGLLVPPGDHVALSQACLELLGDPARRRRMGEAGRRCVDSYFNHDAMVCRIEAVYQQALDPTSLVSGLGKRSPVDRLDPGSGEATVRQAGER